MGNENKDIIRAEFATDAATASGIIAGQVGFSLTSPFKMRHKEKGGTVRSYSSDAGDREQEGKITITNAGEQLRLQYSAGWYTSLTVNNTGELFVSSFGNGVYLSETKLTVTRTTGEQLRLRYDASNYATLTVDSAGDLSISSTGLVLKLADMITSFYASSTLRGTLRVDGHAGTNLSLDAVNASLYFSSDDDITLQADGIIELTPTDGLQMGGKDCAGNWYAHGSSGHTKYLVLDSDGNVRVGATAS